MQHSKSQQKRIETQTEKANPFPGMSDEDLFKFLNFEADIVCEGGRQAVNELIARYENAKRDLHDFSEI